MDLTMMLRGSNFLSKISGANHYFRLLDYASLHDPENMLSAATALKRNYPEIIHGECIPHKISST